MVLDIYYKLREMHREEGRAVLMVVVANEGSSPGRKGFKMAVSKLQMFGTIGGGIMEHKLVEFARSLLDKPAFEPFIKNQIHDKSATADQSGMICSGQQTIAFYDIDSDCIGVLVNVLSEKNVTLQFSEKGLHLGEEIKPYLWHYSESLTAPHKAYVIGGGHVGFALCEVLSRLDFEIHLLDHRQNLNTMEANTFAHYKMVVAFEDIDKHIPEGNEIYVIIMSFAYRTDDIIIRRLLGKNYKYLGMMGSHAKIATLFENLVKDGYDQRDLDKVHAPIGIDIKSETTQEIAISVAAQLISIKNRE